MPLPLLSALGLLVGRDALASAAGAVHPLPRWRPTWQLNRSTMLQPCNYSGYFDPEFSARFGVVSYDWSNAKQQWANRQPMDCEERLLEQARRTKEANPATKVWLYRNLVKALPWFSSVRRKLEDPAFSGFFLKFDPSRQPWHVPACDRNYDPPRCSDYYHDQNATTPEMRGGAGIDPWQSCTSPCDCGRLPCGEYVWDHRNGSMLRNFLIDEYVLGATGLGSPLVDGFFFDDEWQSQPTPSSPEAPPATKECQMYKTGGPTELEFHCVEDMGLGPADVRALAGQWQLTIDQLSQKLLERGGYSWQMMASSKEFGRNRTGLSGARSSCTPFLRQACAPDAPIRRAPLFYEWTGTTSHHQKPAFPFRAAEQDIAMFLLVRGEWSWLGVQWLGCTHGTEPASPAPPDDGEFALPAQLDLDVGEPLGVCTEVREGVFEREWSNYRVRMDCNAWRGELVPSRPE